MELLNSVDVSFLVCLLPLPPSPSSPSSSSFYSPLFPSTNQHI